ncbi:TetR/AcrR family transcriptional regulator [Gordonia rhizosphera]|uniref:Putative TetR family transcriptional regulator n=1 Tax=Gordonia rhizosphera NBRC 16068 TaxID=1108045 RepID=K6VX44_9ACTN|nr:TetR/AcrR family transcriptional regulator [Gordonia rhizosphera]GAB91490.1 putative TetR family transcriptional regulator [Gordonia rhizosphera NBRC 16068]
MPRESVDSTKTPVTARGERTRAALVAAARTVFERDGFTDSRLTDITAEAGCATGSFYTYFDSKEEILDAVLAAAQEDMLHPGLPHVEAEFSDDPAAVIEASNRAYFEAYRRNAQLMLVREQVAGISPEFREIRRRRGQVFVERNARRIRELQERGLADPDLDPLGAAAALSGMVSRMAYSAFALGDDVDIDDLVFTATRLWVNGIGLRRPA